MTEEPGSRVPAVPQSLLTGAPIGPRLEIGGPDGMAVAVLADGSRKVLIGPPAVDDAAGAVECDLATMAVVEELRSWTPAALTPTTNTAANDYELGVQAGVRIASERLRRRAHELAVQSSVP